MADKQDIFNLKCKEHHGHDDFITHYTKCLEFCLRNRYWSTLDWDSQQTLGSHLKRIQYLRKVVQQDQEDGDKLLHDMNVSFMRWRQDDPFIRNIEAVRYWRSAQTPPKLNGQSEPRFLYDEDVSTPDYDPERDFHASIISYGSGDACHLRPPQLPFNDAQIQGRFPDHRMKVSELFRETERDSMNPLEASRQFDNITYFHIPANNMSWVEKALARYHGEKEIDCDAIGYDSTVERRSQTRMLLQRNDWKNQGTCRSRSIRPMCERLWTGLQTVNLNAGASNIVLFAPYLHWETDNYQRQMSQAADKEKDRQSNQIFSSNLGTESSERIGQFLPNGGIDSDTFSDQTTRQPTFNCNGAPKKEARKELTISSVIQATLAPYPGFTRHLESRIFRHDAITGRLLAGHKLGQVLLDAARLYIAMSLLRDRCLTEQYLLHNPPLHPRRTLHQASFTCKYSKQRDRDGLVYQRTRPSPSYLLHSVTRWTKQRNCPTREELLEKIYPKDGSIISQEDKGEAMGNPKCPDCYTDSRKLARVVMVDQLWMWILDGKTLLTFFPSRYGVQDHEDHSGVHRLVRKRLESLPEGHIRTVYDLALIVLLEVTNVFFDRAKTRDNQPQVLGIFENTINELIEQQEISFGEVWEISAKISKVITSPSSTESWSLPWNKGVLTELGLHHHINLVNEELDMMLTIKSQQQDVVRKFISNCEDILDPRGTWHKLGCWNFDEEDSDDDPQADQEAPEGIKEKLKAKAKRAEDCKRKNNYFWFKSQAERMLEDIDNHIGELKGLRTQVENVSKSLDKQLDLAQQQASVLRDWQSAQQAKKTANQGQAVMMFTTVTIIFLPLSFMTGLFGMNNNTFTLPDGNTMSFHEQLNYMIPISVTLIVITLTLPYVMRSKPIAFLFAHLLVRGVTIRSSLFSFWIGINWYRDRMVRITDKWLEGVKREVIQIKQAKVRARLVEQEEMRRRRATTVDNSLGV